MALVLAIGIVLAVVGLVLLFDLFGAGDYVIRTVTSKYLGSLPPGFAASRRGFQVYATLLIAVGIVCIGLGLTAKVLPIGAGLIVIGALIFGIASVVAISGEVETARGKPKTGR
ncbi:MAG TPA: hypothetical protein VFL27_00950 [Candidatus Dormibacteraeota bacterium]|nr:hypothetical protein [Candidatus Dormibacteraeota bacterium]